MTRILESRGLDELAPFSVPSKILPVSYVGRIWKADSYNLFQHPFVTVSAGRYTCSVDDIGDFVHGMTFAVSAKILSTPIMHLIHLPGRMIRQCTCYCLSGSLCRDPALGVFLALGAQVIFLHFHLILFFVKVFIFAV